MRYIVFLLIASLLIAPSGELTTWDGVFRWQGVPDATWYLLEVWQGQTQVFRQWYPMTCSECSVSVPTLKPGSYSWQVLDWGAYGYGTWSGFTSFAFAVLQTETPIPPPVVWTVPNDGTFAEAMETMTDCGTVYINADLAEPAISYGDNRTASYIIPDYGCDWHIIGNGHIVTYDPQNPPMYYGAPGVLMMVKNSKMTTVEGVHFIGTMAMGDGVNIDRDICLLLDAPGNMDVIGNEFEQCGHAGFKHFYGEGVFLLDGNTFHDNGFTSRDHHTYLPGGGQYVIRNNRGWNASGWCVGYGNVYYTTGAVITNNICWDNGGGISVGIGEGAQVENNIAIGNDRGLWLEGGGNVIINNVFMESSIEDVYSERSCGAILTNWCTNPVPNDFFGNGNLYEVISHPDRIQ